MAYPVSNRWYPTLTDSHSVAVKFEVFTANCAQLLYQSPVFVNGSATWPNPTATQPAPKITDGKVSATKMATVRSQFSLTLVDPTGFLIPATRVAPLTCWGNEIRIYRGLAYSDGTTEMPRLGTFRITDVETDETKGVPTITVKGQDRSRIASRHKVTDYYQSGTGAAYTDIIRQALRDVYPAIRFKGNAFDWYLIPPAGIGQGGTGNRIVYTGIVPLLYQEGADMMVEMRKLAATLSCDLFFDRDGLCNLVLDPNLNYMSAGSLATPPVTTFVEGETARFTGIKRILSDQNSYNSWVITGEGQIIGTGPLRSAPANDTDRNSPTFIYGSYGVVNGFETNTLMKTQAQVDSYAQFRLRTQIGAQETLQTTGFVDTSLSVDDPIAITRKKIGVNNVAAIIDSIDYPLTAKGLQTIKFRERRAL